MKEIISFLGLAGFVSLLSLAATWVAIVFLIEGEPFLAIYSALAAFLLDSLDGYIARNRHTESVFGRQLDSMVDFLNYSVFSALLLLLYIAPNILGALVGFVIISTGALRLVRFNIEGLVQETGEKYYAGIVVCFLSFTAALLFLGKHFLPEITFWVASPILLALSILQLSRIKVRKTNMYPVWFTLAFLLLILTIWVDAWIK